MAQTKLRVDGVFEGGGVKGIGLVGAVSVIEAAGYEFVNLAVGVKARDGEREPNAFSADPQEPLSLLQTAGSAQCSV